MPPERSTSVAGWWNQPIVYQKAILWTVLLETIGVAGSWGPLASKIKPIKTRSHVDIWSMAYLLSLSFAGTFFGRTSLMVLLSTLV